MGIRLFRVALDNAPPDLTISRRLTLAVLAFYARHGTRTGSVSWAKLARGTRLSDRNLRQVLTTLAERGLIQPIKPFRPGQRVVYRIVTDLRPQQMGGEIP